jgi:1,4-alpha-glucan branching enzyme
MSKAHHHQTSCTTRFTCHAPAAQAMFLAGPFNGWNPKATPMAKDTDGNWSVALDRHEFKFVVDGQWCCEPGCEGSRDDCPKCVHNPFGAMNRAIEVK